MKRERIPGLIAEINDELEALEQVVISIKTTAEQMPREDETGVYKESLALKLHNLYTGCERIFAKIAVDLNGGVPPSTDWHRRMLHVMALDINGVRPPVISKTVEKDLYEFLAFRHLVRNIYGFELDMTRIESLIGKVEPASKRFKDDLGKFLEFLGTLTG